MNKEFSQVSDPSKRRRRRVSRARREAFRRKKIDTTAEYFHPLFYF